MFTIRPVDTVSRFVEMENFLNFSVMTVILTMEMVVTPPAKLRQTSVVCTVIPNHPAFVLTMVKLDFN